jgi:GTP cyclohydrolase FolE2
MPDVPERPNVPDVQGPAAPPRVGLPWVVAQREGALQAVVARAALSVDLPHHQKGAHRSRLVEALEDWRTQPASGAASEAVRTDVRR